MLCQLPGPQSKGTAVGRSTPSALILVCNNIPQKKELLLLGDMADSRGGGKQDNARKREIQKEKNRGERKVGVEGREEKRRGKKEKTKTWQTLPEPRD